MILIHDLGTSGVKACLFDDEGKLLAKEYRRYSTYYPEPGKAVQRPDEWWNAVCDTTRILLKKTGVSSEEISCISWSAQMQAVIPVDKRGNVLLNDVMIYVDSRAQEESNYIINKLGGLRNFYEITACGQSVTNYPVAKILWLKRQKETTLYVVKIL